MSDNESNNGPLKDIRVIELGQLIAGPFCGQLMADMGADVIKVEPPGTGDPMRKWGRGDYPLWWSVCARNKKCVTANLREPEGQEIAKNSSNYTQCDSLLMGNKCGAHTVPYIKNKNFDSNIAHEATTSKIRLKGSL